MSCRRSNRVRFKPLDYWNNEKLHFDVHGDLQYVKAMKEKTNSSHSKLLDETAMSCQNLSIIPIKIGEKKHEASILQLVPEQIKSTVIDNRTDGVEIRKYIKKVELGRKTYSTSEISGIKCSNDKSKYSYSEKNGKIKRNTYDIDNTLMSHSEDTGFTWKLTDMYKIENELNEKYFIQRGAHDPKSNMYTGFLFLVSNTLHWDTSTEKEIFVIEGSGKLSVERNGKSEMIKLSKGLTFQVKTGNIILEKEKHCSILKLCVVQNG